MDSSRHLAVNHVIQDLFMDENKKPLAITNYDVLVRKENLFWGAKAKVEPEDRG